MQIDRESWLSIFCCVSLCIHLLVGAFSRTLGTPMLPKQPAEIVVPLGASPDGGERAPLGARPRRGEPAGGAGAEARDPGEEAGQPPGEAWRAGNPGKAG